MCSLHRVSLLPSPLIAPLPTLPPAIITPFSLSVSFFPISNVAAFQSQIEETGLRQDLPYMCVTIKPHVLENKNKNKPSTA